MTKKRKDKSELKIINAHSAGVDVGSASHWVALDPSLGDHLVHEFGAYTQDLNELADWLLSHDVQTVAMESTGIYWIPLYELLRDRGLDVCLVDARATKQVAGRKTDVSDCQWIQQLHSYGLLKPAFIPDAQVSTLRAYMRQRERWVADAGRAIQHMQQAMELMNVKLTEVVSNVTGTTGLAIIDAILAGERNPKALSTHRDPHCKRSHEEIARALEGTWHKEHLFALEQARQHYAFLCQRIEACDAQLDRALALYVPNDPPKTPPPSGRAKRDQSPHPFKFDAHRHCLLLAGVDLTTVNGVGVNTVMTVLAEVGTDLSPWRSEKAFGAWLGLAPNPRKSGGRVLRSRTVPNANRAATAFRLSARSLANSNSALGAFYRRLRARIGAPKAITAAAYKIARIFYRMLTTKKPFLDVGQSAYDERFRARRLRSITRIAKDLGLQLVPAEA